MTWSIEFLEEAEKDMKKLDHSAQIQVLKGISKVSQNPLPAEEGGYGKPLGNKSGTNLTNFLKIKFRDLGIRVVYKVERVNGIMKILPELMSRFIGKHRKEGINMIYNRICTRAAIRRIS